MNLKAVNDMSNISEKDQLLMNWQNAKASADAAIALERDLRAKVVDTFFPDTAKRNVGVNNFDLGRGYQLKATLGLTYKLATADDAKATGDAVDAIEALGNEGSFIAERMVKWKPELSVKEYKALDLTNPTHKKIKELIDGVLTITPASPQVEVVVPKSR